MTLNRLLLVANAFVFVVFGLAFLVAADALAAPLGFDLTPSAAADFRAMYGGFSLSIGIVFIAALVRSDWEAFGIFVILVSSAMIFVGRSIAVTGAGATLHPIIYVFLAMEAFSAGAAALLIARSRRLVPAH